ncbi:MAG: RIP metalloprotease RseP [Crocinitomicaceae bacterium]
MIFLIKAAQLILSLSILVFLHELGHFIPARLFKTRVEKFYLFFNPWFSLYKRKIGETEWGIGWLPLGGYVKIAGMIDESMDTEQMKEPAKDWEFRAKPAWQRLIIMIGGVVVNILLGYFIYIMVFFTWGEEVIHTDKLQAGMSIHPYMEKHNLRSGDIILEVDGEKVIHTNDINNAFIRGVEKLKVQRPDGKVEEVSLPEDLEYELFAEGAIPVVNLRSQSLKIEGFDASDSSMLNAGFKEGDQFLAINDVQINYDDDVDLAKFKYKGSDVDVSVLRGNDTLQLKTAISETGQMGFLRTFKFVDTNAISTAYYGFGESIGKGIKRGTMTLNNYVSQLKFLFTKKGASSIGGFAAIGNMFPPVWDWHQFWLTTALISIILAFMNILPIPALDGGHVVFLLYEMITGREAPQKVLEYAQYAGFILLMGLVLFANGNDLIKWLFG